MLKKEYTCPKCNTTVSFLPLVVKRACPRCGRKLMNWDLKQAARAGMGNLSPRFVMLVFLGIAAALGAYLYFRK